ncbi:LLM class flavin-dependent oxidoreductase [Roseisolibacter sp. H3M3-2]|uniref:LLM class flavin-dependent oxidoreductase n=1 Tax=Roseisolibacter sp. H3M3-2 TaxID=3031323 RepID=UPI0023DB95FF|nr:LLM class flavin-dependent oxidoreductase [Roseisolibacter sp. H3M3-2]MDF1503279.1 LLM class flavin-dependent oxidoreductase [Roseisolibacter sp. H3M3-2]
MTDSLELGLDTFGDVTRGADGQPLSHAQVIRDVVEEAVLADAVGADFFGVGEHHRADFAVTAPEVVLAAIAGRTRRIRLGSAVTVLSSDDPVRVFQRFATLDAASGGRAEVILGRGSFTESFPLFGHPMRDYDRLFEEKLALFAAILEQDRTGEPVTWRGETRAALEGQRVYPTTESGRLRTWVGVGGSPESVVRAASYGFPLTLAIIGGPARRFAPYAALYRRTLEKLGRPALPVAVHSPGHVADTDEQARAEFWPAWREMRDRIGAERGWGPTSPDEFAREVAGGSLYVGAPETVARKIADTARALGIARFDMKYSAGPLAHPLLMRSIELYGRVVIPRVRELLAESGAAEEAAPALFSVG